MNSKDCQKDHNFNVKNIDNYPHIELVKCAQVTLKLFINGDE